MLGAVNLMPLTCFKEMHLPDHGALSARTTTASQSSILCSRLGHCVDASARAIALWSMQDILLMLDDNDVAANTHTLPSLLLGLS